MTETNELLTQATPDDLSRLDAMITQAEAADTAGEQGKAATREDQPPAPTKTAKQPITAPDQGKKIETINDLINQPDTPTDADKGKKPDEQANPDDKSEANLSRFEKAKRREAEAWNKINSEKTRIAEERAKLTKERDEWQQKFKPVATDQFTADQYETAAEKFEADGKFDLAEAAREKAQELRANPPKPAQPDAAKPAQQMKEFVDLQTKYWNQAKQEVPEVLDPKSPVNATLKEILKLEPEFLQHPKGPYFAAKLAKAETAAARVPEMENQIVNLKTELEKLKKLTALPSEGIPSHVRSEKSFGEMTTEEMERELNKDFALSR